MRRDHLLFVLALAAVIAASGYLVVVLHDHGERTPAALGWLQLANATYPSDLVRSKQVTLRDGAFEEPVAPGSAAKVQVRLADIAAFGAIDADNLIDSAVVLIGSGGGSGTFINLVAVLNQAGQPNPVASALLGDRIAVRAIEIKDHKIVVRMRVRGPSDPLTSLTREVARTYSLKDGQLKLDSESEADVPATPPSAFSFETRAITLAPGGKEYEASGILGPGQSLNLVVHAQAGERLVARVTSDFNNVVFSVQGLGDLAQVVSRSEFKAFLDSPLPSTQDYSVRLVSLAGSNIQYSVSLKLTGAATPTPPPKAAVPSPSAKPQPPDRNSGRQVDLPLLVKGAINPDRKGLAEIAPEAARFAEERSGPLGIALMRPSEGVLYNVNGDAQVELASVVKVLIMAAILRGADQEGRFVDDAELNLLWPMISQSDNDAATALWNRIGRGIGLGSSLKAAGLNGISPYDGDYWGTSTGSANAMAVVLARLFFGDLLSADHRRLAFALMQSVIPQQRWGVSEATEASSGDAVALKNGWYEAEAGWRINSVGVVIPADLQVGPFVLAVLSNRQPSLTYGIETIEEVARRAGTLVGRTRSRAGG